MGLYSFIRGVNSNTLANDLICHYEFWQDETPNTAQQ